MTGEIIWGLLFDALDFLESNQVARSAGQTVIGEDCQLVDFVPLLHKEKPTPLHFLLPRSSLNSSLGSQKK